MAYPIASGMTLSTAAYAKTANLITGRNQFIGKGTITVVARGSAAGMNISFIVGGVAIIDDISIPYFGATGTLDSSVHVVANQSVAGGVTELYLRNTSAGALTTDYVILFTPSK